MSVHLSAFSIPFYFGHTAEMELKSFMTFTVWKLYELDRGYVYSTITFAHLENFSLSLSVFFFVLISQKYFHASFFLFPSPRTNYNLLKNIQHIYSSLSQSTLSINWTASFSECLQLCVECFECFKKLSLLVLCLWEKCQWLCRNLVFPFNVFNRDAIYSEFCIYSFIIMSVSWKYINKSVSEKKSLRFCQRRKLKKLRGFFFYFRKITFENRR